MSTVTERATTSRRHPSTTGYRLAAALALIGVLAAGAWVFTSCAGATPDVAGFTRVATVGPGVVTIDRAGTYLVYYEAPRGMMMGSGPSVRVTDPSGRPLAMRPGSGMRSGMRYGVPGRPGCVGRMVGRFHAGMPGRYHVWVDQPDPQATIALTRDTR